MVEGVIIVVTGDFWSGWDTLVICFAFLFFEAMGCDTLIRIMIYCLID